jgi:hypothetical protein
VKELASGLILNLSLILVLKYSFKSQNLTSVGFLRETGLTGFTSGPPLKRYPGWNIPSHPFTSSSPAKLVVLLLYTVPSFSTLSPTMVS